MRILRTSAFIGMALSAMAVGAAHAKVDHDIRRYVCGKLDDFTATVAVLKADQRELGKISRDFGLAYKFPSITMRYKEPNLARLEGTHEGSKIVFILTGTKQIVMVNGRKLSEKDYGKSPGKRKSLMDVGLVSDFYLTYTNARFMREATVDGTPCAVFDMTYKDRDEDTSHHIIYIDPVTKSVRKRESYSQEGKLQAVFNYKNIQQIKPGIWVPTEVEVQNTDRVVAGVTAYRNIKVNTDIPETIFRP